jgi:hypothetical protein
MSKIETETVARFDRGVTLDSYRTDNGFLKIEATVGRVGVLNYRRPDGTIQRELRPADEVFHADSLESLSMVPLTLGHPPRATTGGLVAPENAAQHVIGHTGENSKRLDGDRLAANVMITHDSGINAVEAGTRQLSPGYTTELDHTPGVWNGQPYDAIQRKIRYNHVALVERGRAGPTVSLHLDSDAAEIDQPIINNKEESKPMDLVKINLDGVDFDVTEQAKQAFEQRLDAKESEVKDLSDKLAEASARADSLAADLEASKEALRKATSPEAVADAVQTRLGLERKAAEVLGEAKLDEMADRDIKVEVVKAVNPAVEAKLDCDVYLDAAFDLAVESHKNRQNDALASARKESESTRKDAKNDAVDVYAAFAERQKNAWRAK